MNGHMWGQISQTKKFIPHTVVRIYHIMYLLHCTEVQKETFCKKSTKGIYFPVQIEEISKMNGHKWGQIS